LFCGNIVIRLSKVVGRYVPTGLHLGLYSVGLSALSAPKRRSYKMTKDQMTTDQMAHIDGRIGAKLLFN